MNSFDPSKDEGTQPPTTTEQQGKLDLKKPDVVTVEKPKVEERLIPRFYNDKKLWNEAMIFAQMLTFCRPHLSRTESRFINQYIRPVGVQFDKKGNLYKKIGDSPVLWSSHIDTVHSKKGMQKIEYWTERKTGDTFLGVMKESKSSCLGADDTAGIWIMLEMIKGNVPGTYIFHRGEECGGLGSKWISENKKEILKDIKFAIAFDRRDTRSVITQQRGSRCCSDDFADSLIEQLGMGHFKDTTGAFTDTANYVDHIGECTNISAGYYDAHCPEERVNMDYLFRLRDAMLKIDVAKLVEKRKPGEKSPYTYTYYRGRDSGYWDGHKWRERSKPEGCYTYFELRDKHGWKGVDDQEYLKDYYYDNKIGYWRKWADDKKVGSTKSPYTTYQALVKLVRDYPAVIADLLESQGFSELEVQEYIDKCWVKDHLGY